MSERQFSRVPPLTVCDLALSHRACALVAEALSAGSATVGEFKREVEYFAAVVDADRVGVNLGSVVLPHGARVVRLPDTEVDVVLVPKQYAFGYARLGKRLVVMGMAGMAVVVGVLVSRLVERGRL